MGNNDGCQFWVGVFDSDGVLQLFFVDKHLAISLLFREFPGPGVVQPAIGLVLAGTELGQRAMLRLELFFGFTGHLGVLLEQVERLGIILMSVQIKPQLSDHKQQGLELSGDVVRQVGGVHLQMEGKVQRGEKGSVGQCAGLVVFLTALLLKGNIWYSQRRAGRHGAAAIRAWAGIDSGIRIQANPSFNESSAAVRLSSQLMRRGGEMTREMSKKNGIEFRQTVWYNESTF